MSEDASSSQSPAQTESDSADSSEHDVRQLAERLLKGVRSHRRRVSRVKNLLGKVKGKDPSAASYAAWLEVQRGLDGYEMGVADLDEQRAELVGRLGKEMVRLRMKTRMKVVQKLQMLADNQGLAFEKVSESPLVLYADPLTFEIDFDAGAARLLFGHESITDVPLDATRLLEARRNALDDIDRRAIASEEFFDLLNRAYRTALIADDAASGARVDLVDVLMPLSMLLVDSNQWRKKGPDAIQAYPRHQLAWQLAQLRRDGVLERGGMRLDLGAATGGSTRNKKNVLYIPVGAKNGQYYGSLRFDES